MELQDHPATAATIIVALIGRDVLQPPAAFTCPGSPADLGLTARQVEVLALMMQGKSNKAISRILDVAEPTVKHHVSAILKALKVMSRTEAVIAVGSFGWELPRIGDP